MQNLTRTSKFLSQILRHRPEKIGLALDQNGWAAVSELLEKLNAHDHSIDFQELKAVVETNDKQRFAFSPDFTKIRANQGHSVQIDLKLKPVVPPEVLFHGTATKNADSIRRQGLHSGNRQHVHLSFDENTAVKVGGRHGSPFVLRVLSGEMHLAGHLFYCSENGVWLTEQVPSKYLEWPELRKGA